MHFQNERHTAADECKRSSSSFVFLYSVVSWGISCADYRFPGVYAKVPSAFQWIQQVTCYEWQVDSDYCIDEYELYTEAPTASPTTRNCLANETHIDWRFHTDGFG